MTSPQQMYPPQPVVQPVPVKHSGWLRYVIAAVVLALIVGVVVIRNNPGVKLAESTVSTSSRSNPLPVGVPGRVASWTLTFGATDTDAAAELAGSDYLVDLESGDRFVMAPVKVAYRGANSKAPSDLRFRFVGSAGNTFDGGFGCGIFKGDVTSVEPMFADASEDARVCVPVPADQIDGGVWQVVELFGSDNGTFFATR